MEEPFSALGVGNLEAATYEVVRVAVVVDQDSFGDAGRA
jgi:hypothetical protein